MRETGVSRISRELSLVSRISQPASSAYWQIHWQVPGEWPARWLLVLAVSGGGSL